jgi:transmembrane sensor
MAKVYPLSTRKEIKEEAADWLIKMDGDRPLNRQQRQELKQWIARSPVHSHELAKLNRFWSNNNLTELMVPLGRQHSTQPISWWALLCKGAAGRQRGMAATLVVCVALAGLWSLAFSGDPLERSNGIYLTAVGQNKSVTLADGSVVQLNTNSQIKVEYTDKFRNIRLLQGEAHFDVTKNLALPFRVYAGDGRFEAVGTAFNVHLKNRDIDLMVTEGRVAVASLNSAQNSETNSVEDSYAKSRLSSLGIIDAGQRLQVKAKGQTVLSQQSAPETIEALSEEDIARQQAWRRGMLVFSGESLEQVVAEISRYTTITIDIIDPDVRKIQIGGRIRVGDIDEMLASLQANFGLNVKRLSFNRVELSAASH